jgi:predicted phage replisome organizer
VSDVKWIKITTDIFDDEKILLIESLPMADNIITIWFKLLTLAGKQNNGGVFVLNDKIAYTDEMLATIFRRDINTVRMALNTFEQFGMIDIVDGVITIPNWGKHQNIEGIEKRLEYQKNYQREYRKKQKQIAEQVSDTTNDENERKHLHKHLREQNVNALEKEIEVDKEKEVDYLKEKVKDKSFTKKKDQFVIPTVDEVREYCQSVGSQVDAEHFHAFYESKGWLVGNSKMKSWKAAIVTWEKKGGLKRIPPKQPEEPQSRFSCIPKEFYEELRSKGAIDDDDCLHYGNITKDELKRLEEYGVSL